MIDNKKIVIGVVILISAYLVDYFFMHPEERMTLSFKYGELKGKVSLSRDGREYYEFLGVPYAEPPLEKLRFMSPKPVKPWTGVRDATKYQSKCMQVDMLTNLKGGSEDCLYLNVFSPKTTGTPTVFPVIVYFHGGNFMYGDAKMFGPKYFMDSDVVLVTVNYRLASLGFLNANNKYARGNMGLKDQVQALKWIQENIPYFGGDRDRIILMGNGAGASSAHLHMFSKMSSGLFHGVISASGTALAPFSLQTKPQEQAKRLGKRLRCPINRKSEAMVACLGQAEVQRLVESHREAVQFLRDPIAMYGPTIETIDDNEAFLTKDPLEMLKKGEIVNKVPLIIGVTSEEGRGSSASILRNSSMIQEMEQHWEENFQRALRYFGDASVHKKIRDFYFGTTEGQFVTRENEQAFSQLFGDRMHVVPTYRSVAAHAKKSPVYLYHFAQPAATSYADVVYNQNGILPPVVEIGTFLAFNWVSSFFGRSPPARGVSHFDDQTFLFNMQFLPEYNAGDDNYEFSRELIKLLVSFAKNGKPSSFLNVDWEPVSADSESPVKMLEITKIPKMIQDPFAKRVQFWNSLNLR